MEKIDYLETKINEILYELNYIKEDFNKTKNNLNGIQTHNFVLNSNFLINQQGAESYLNSTGLESKEVANKWFLTGKGSYENYGRIFLYPSAYLSQTLNLEDGIKTLLGKEATLTFFVRDGYGPRPTMGARIWIDDNNYIEETKVISGVATNSITFSVPHEAIKIEIFVEDRREENTESFTNIAWAKLELGATHSNYIYPSYEKEVLDCNLKNLEYSEIFYDMSSSDSNINLGYTSGIKGGTKITGLDFSKYKKIKVYSVIDWDYSNFCIDLKKLVSSYGYYSSSVANPRISSGTLYVYGCFASVNKDKSNFSIEFFRGNTKFNNNTNYYCYKIEGIY